MQKIQCLLWIVFNALTCLIVSKMALSHLCGWYLYHLSDICVQNSVVTDTVACCYILYITWLLDGMTCLLLYSNSSSVLHFKALFAFCLVQFISLKGCKDITFQGLVYIFLCTIHVKLETILVEIHSLLN
jgi:hypothetical protein